MFLLIREAEESYELLFASWGLSKARDVFSALMAGEPGAMKDREDKCFHSARDDKSLPSPVHCIQATKEWVPPT